MTDYLAEGRRIWHDFVPESGQADTVQGEMLRAVEKLRDEATRNGNGNWDAGFEILHAYLRETLPDPAVFSPEVCEEIRSTLAALRREDDVWLQDEPYDFLGDRVVDYFRHHGSRPRAMNPDLHR